MGGSKVEAHGVGKRLGWGKIWRQVGCWLGSNSWHLRHVDAGQELAKLAIELLFKVAKSLLNLLFQCDH